MWTSNIAFDNVSNWSCQCLTTRLQISSHIPHHITNRLKTARAGKDIAKAREKKTFEIFASQNKWREGWRTQDQVLTALIFFQFYICNTVTHTKLDSDACKMTLGSRTIMSSQMFIFPSLNLQIVMCFSLL